MKIAFIAGTLGQGGAERQLFYILKTLKQNGHDPYVLCLMKGQFWESRIRDLGIPVIWVGKSSKKLFRLLSIIREISKRSADVIHSQHFPTNLYAYVAGLILRKRSIGSLRSNVYDEIADAGLLGKFSFALPKLLVCNSRNGINNAINLGKSRSQLFYLPNVVNENYFKPILTAKVHQKLQVAFVGTIWPPKRVDRIIRAARKCLDQGLNVEFNLFGGGELFDFMISYASELSVLGVNLKFHGEISDSRIAYQQADVLLLTSDREGTPNVLLEAMACGLPIISTNVGDVSSFITDGVNGFLADSPEEELKIVEALRTLSENLFLAKEMGLINRSLIEERASLGTLSQLLSELYSLQESTK